MIPEGEIKGLIEELEQIMNRAKLTTQLYEALYELQYEVVCDQLGKPENQQNIRLKDSQQKAMQALTKAREVFEGRG